MKIKNNLTGEVSKVLNVTNNAIYLEDNKTIPALALKANNFEFIPEEGDSEEVVGKVRGLVDKMFEDKVKDVKMTPEKMTEFKDIVVKVTGSVLSGITIGSMLSGGKAPLNIGMAINIGFKTAEALIVAFNDLENDANKEKGDSAHGEGE